MPTFPFTPGFVHGETLAQAVTVHRFEDWSEQRYLGSRQVGRRLHYEFPFPSSSTIAGISSFYQSMGGPLTPFTVVDHRDKSSFTMRFAAPSLDHLRGPHIRRSLTVEFIEDQGGITPLATGYVPNSSGDFCEPVVPTSGVVSASDANPDAWVWAGGPVRVSPGAKWVSLTGNHTVIGSTSNEYEHAMPVSMTLVSMAMRIHDIGSAGSVQLKMLVNGNQPGGLTVIGSGTNTTAIGTGTVGVALTSLVAIQATLLSTNSADSALISYSVGYRNES